MKMGRPLNAPNIYSSPEYFGLSIVDVLDDPLASYAFEMLVVWSDQDGTLYYGCDNGCSCPSPFEEFEGIHDLTPITDDTWDEFAKDVTELAEQGDMRHLSDGAKCEYQAFQVEKTRLLAKVALLLRENHK